MECVGYFSVANERKSLLGLFPANIRTGKIKKTPGITFVNSSMFWQPFEFSNVKESSLNINEAI